MRRLVTTLLVIALAASAHARDPSGVAFRTPDLQTVTLQEVTGRSPLTLLNFWATWCAPCRDELPLLLHAETGPELALVAVNLGETPARVNEYLASNDLQELPVLYLTGRDSALLQVPGVPSSLLLDRQGNVIATHYGAFSAATLASFLAEWSPNP